MRQRIPIIYLVDSAGVNLPYQGGVFPGQYGAARIFYYNSIMRRYLHVPQISAVMGSCIAGGAYLPALSDVIFMVEGTSFMGLGGPNLVKGATGQTIDARDAGRRADPHRAERRGPLPGRQRRRVPGPDPRVRRPAARGPRASAPHASGPSARPPARRPVRHPAAGPPAVLRHAPGAGLPARRRRAGRVPARHRAGDALRPRPHRGPAGRGHRQPARASSRASPASGRGSAGSSTPAAPRRWRTSSRPRAGSGCRFSSCRT